MRTGLHPDAREHFMVLRSSVLSGMLVPVGTGAVIPENDSHDPLRRRSTMGYELAHVILWHEFKPGIVDERKCRLSSKEDEAEAAYFGGELLLPLKAAQSMAFRDFTDELAALKFQVSLQIAVAHERDWCTELCKERQSKGGASLGRTRSLSSS